MEMRNQKLENTSEDMKGQKIELQPNVALINAKVMTNLKE